MNVFYEFYRLAQRLQESEIAYALVGGVALAFYELPRFTKDIDILVSGDDHTAFAAILMEEGYRQMSEPWKFAAGGTSLYRYVKLAEDDDEMVVDLLVAESDAHESIIRRARTAESEQIGVVRVATKADLIWLKQQRNSKQDQVDIERLEDNEGPS